MLLLLLLQQQQQLLLLLLLLLLCCYGVTTVGLCYPFCGSFARLGVCCRWDFVQLALQRIKETCAAAQQQQQQQQVQGAGLFLCCLRFLSNLLVLPTNRAVLLQHAQQVCYPFSSCVSG